MSTGIGVGFWKWATSFFSSSLIYFSDLLSLFTFTLVGLSVPSIAGELFIPAHVTLFSQPLPYISY